MKAVFQRDTLPQTILSVLPLTLFFPVGIINAGVLLFLLSLLFAGDYRTKWLTAKSNPLFWPVLVMFIVTCLSALIVGRPQSGFWNGFAHYQVYIFLLFFVSVGAGDWQRRAVTVFFIGAICAATLYYLNLLKVLPEITPFNSYVAYAGNKSISLGVMLAIAAAWMLYEITVLPDRRWLWVRIIAFLYVVIALLLLTKTRTASLIFVLLCGFIFLKHFSFSRRGGLWLLGFLLLLGVAWQSASDLRTRMIGTIKDISTFAQGKKVSEEGNRLEILSITSEIIAERPLLGHGIATWAPLYEVRAQGLSSAGMVTPHNDYLLYAAEIGLIGLAVLLWTWGVQLAVAWKIGGDHGMLLGMLGVAVIVGGMFNAILRDLVFGMPFMILLAIPLAGVVRKPGIKWRNTAG